MKGSITARGKNVWRLRYDGPPTPDGKRKILSETIHGPKKDAEVTLRERLTALETGRHVSKNRETLAHFMESWLTGHAQSHTKPRTFMGYKQKVRAYIIPCLGGVQIQKLAPRHVQDLHQWILAKGLSNQSVVHAHRVLALALKHAVSLDVIPKNPAELVSPPKPEPKAINVWDLDNIRRFLVAAKESQFQEVFRLAILTGLRRSELTGLTWKAISFESGTLRVIRTLRRVTGKGLLAGEPKSQAGKRSVALDETALDVLHSIRGKQLSLQAELGDLYQNAEGYVFTDDLGSPIDSDRLSREFTKIVRGTELPSATLHSLRHCHVSLLLEDGRSIRLVADRVGHADPSLTLRVYSHLMPRTQLAAANALGKKLAGL